MKDYKKILQIEVHNIVDRLQNGLIHPYTAKQEIFNSTLKAINYTHCCESDSEQLCECDAPLIITSNKVGEFCGFCQKDLDQHNWLQRKSISKVILRINKL